MWGYLFAILGFAIALILLWLALSRREKSKEKVATYTCSHCGECDCICQKDRS